ncbi:succinate dehydrogenase, hydrophobic membrane anchor protein [Granulosicoccus sp.]|nr:succinate dehydrogenase, hydrophobic membrane anchor protein [Granulosicoccus sp.]MDB4222237.1 succinate dehydrogenase, hydrophobic membrane anchor protein [Granulosicoccus sp.]
MSNFRTPLKKVKGLGSAKEGTGHFWSQRLTALALVPLVLWLAFSVASLPGMDYVAIREWLSQPFNAIVMILFLIVGFHHARLGLQVVIEDYVSSHIKRTAAIIAVTFIAAALGVTGVFSVLRIAFAG